MRNVEDHITVSVFTSDINLWQGLHTSDWPTEAEMSCITVMIGKKFEKTKSWEESLCTIVL